MKLFFISCSNPDKNNFDGVNLAQQEIYHAMKRGNNSNVIFLNEEILLYPKHLVSLITNDDTVYCSIDPYAPLIYLAREEAGLNFRIGRNVQTGPWNGYLLQEWLCHPLTRSMDIIFYISQYALQVFRNLLPTEELGHHVVCYPEVFTYPKVSNLIHCNKRPYSAAYIGRISFDKGFDVVMESFTKIHEEDRAGKFLVIGKVHPEDFSKSEWSNLLEFGKSIGIRFSGHLSHTQVFNELQRCRTLIFPSTSNVESLGRIVLEACHCRTPVVAAAHAEVPRMLEPASLVPPRYMAGLDQPTSTHFPMGVPSPEDIAEAVLNGVPPIPLKTVDHRVAHWARFCSLLFSPILKSYTIEDTDETCLPPASLSGIQEISKDTAINLITELRDAIRRIVSCKDTALSVFSNLRMKSTHPMRSERFIEQCVEGKMMFDDIGGLPMEACHLLGFDPILHIHHVGWNKNINGATQ